MSSLEAEQLQAQHERGVVYGLHGQPDLPQKAWDFKPRAFIGEREVPFHDFCFLPDRDLAGDGSGTDAKWQDFRRAGWAVVQWDPEGQELRGLYGPVTEGNEQTAAGGEHEAMLQAAMASDGSSQYWADASLVVDGWAKPVKRALAPRSLMAGYWKQLHGLSTQFKGIEKVKAHVVVPEEPGTRQEWAQWLNAEADAYAKKGRKLVGYRQGEIDGFIEQARLYTGRLVVYAKVLASYPRPKDFLGPLSRRITGKCTEQLVEKSAKEPRVYRRTDG